MADVSAYIIWKVENITSITEVGQCVESPEFVIGAKVPTKWQISLYPNGNEQDNEGYVLLFVNSLEGKPITTTHSFQMYFPASDSESDNEAEGPVIVVCHIETENSEGDTVAFEHHFNKKFYDECKMNLWKFKSEKILTDIVIECGDGSNIDCHKVVLAARSKVFKTMFTTGNSDTLESESNSISTDFGFRCMQKVVEFLYLDHLENMEDLELVGEVCQAADYYDIQKLKRICLLELGKMVDAENIFQVLGITCKTNGVELAQKCREIIQVRGMGMSEDEWEKFVPKDCNLMGYLVKQFVEFNKGEPVEDTVVENNPENLKENIKAEGKDSDDDSFLESLWNLYAYDKFCDLSVKCEGQVIQCHEVVLKANAPAFHTDLKTDGDAVIEKFSLSCLMDLMRYIYTGEVQYLENIQELLEAAKEYQLLDLKSSCEKTLLRELNPENAIKFLEVAWNGDCVELRRPWN